MNSIHGKFSCKKKMQIIKNDFFDDNCIALLIAIFRNVSQEQAFVLLENPETSKVKLAKVYTKEDVRDMHKLRKKFSYVKVAEMYGLSEGSMWNKLNIYNKGIMENL